MSPLLDLPREIRDLIWHDLCRQWIRNMACLNPAGPMKNSPFGLLRTCRQAYNELLPQWYGVPVFYLSAPHQALQWVSRIGPHNSKLINHLILKSSFLSMDANQTGRDIAVEAWAKVLRAMPNLRLLTFDHELDGPDWSLMAYSPKNTSCALSDAINDLSKLESLNYLGGRCCNLELLKGKPKLSSLRISNGAVRMRGPKEEYLPQLQFLKTLQLGDAFASTQAWPRFSDWQKLAPSSDIFPSPDIKYRKTRALVFVEDGLPSRKLSVTTSQVWGRAPCTVPNDSDLFWLLANVPNLVYLGIEYNYDPSILAAIPTSVRYLDIVQLDLDYSGQFATRLMPRKFWCDNHELPDVVVSYDHNHGSGKVGVVADAVHSLLYSALTEHLRWLDEQDDHIDQSGLIP